MARYNVFSVLLLSIVLAVASPVNTQATERAKRAVDCDEVSVYTTQWFLDNVLPEYKDSFLDDALFYTRGMTEQANEYARSNKLITLWNIWPCWLYVHHDVPENPMRCIHNDEKKRTTYYENMSRAFALKAKSSATVMHSLTDYDKPPLNGIWGRIELPTIKKDTDVDLLAKIKEDGNDLLLFWWRYYESAKAWLKDQSGLSLRLELKRLVRRGLRSPAYCMRPEEYKFFDNVDW